MWRLSEWNSANIMRTLPFLAGYAMLQPSQAKKNIDLCKESGGEQKTEQKVKTINLKIARIPTTLLSFPGYRSIMAKYVILLILSSKICKLVGSSVHYNNQSAINMDTLQWLTPGIGHSIVVKRVSCEKRKTYSSFYFCVCLDGWINNRASVDVSMFLHCLFKFDILSNTFVPRQRRTMEKNNPWYISQNYCT